MNRFAFSRARHAAEVNAGYGSVRATLDPETLSGFFQVTLIEPRPGMAAKPMQPQDQGNKLHQSSHKKPAAPLRATGFLLRV